MAIGLIVLGTLATLTFISTFSLTKGIVASGGILGGVHYLGSASLDKPSLLSSIGDAITSPFTEISQFLLDYFVTPLILIGFLVLFFFAQYWLIKMYFIFGKKIIEGLKVIIDKLHLKDKGNEILQHFKNMSFH